MNDEKLNISYSEDSDSIEIESVAGLCVHFPTCTRSPVFSCCVFDSSFRTESFTTSFFSFTFLVCFSGVIASVTSRQSVKSNFKTKLNHNPIFNNMLEIAHRGFSGEYKDNTKAAFIGASTNDFDMIETDIQLTRDRKMIVYHDTHLQNRLIKDLNFEEVKMMDTDIMLFSDFFSVVDLSKTKLYLDVKGPNDGVAAALHGILQGKDCDNIYIGCFNTLILDELFRMNPAYKLGLITESLYDENIFSTLIAKWKLKFVSFGWTMLDERIINFLRSKDILVFAYTCHNENEYNFIKEFDLDGIVTDIKLKTLAAY